MVHLIASQNSIGYEITSRHSYGPTPFRSLLTQYAFGLNIYAQNQSFTDVTITGAPLIALSGNSTEFAPLPSDLGTQLYGTYNHNRTAAPASLYSQGIKLQIP